MSEQERVSDQRKSKRMSKGIPPKRYSPSIEDPGMLGENADVSAHNQPGEMGTGTGPPSEKNSMSSKASHHSKKREQARLRAELDEAKARAQLEAEEIQQQLEFQKRERERDQAEAELNRKAREVKKNILEKELATKLSLIEVTSDDSQSIGSEEDAEVLSVKDNRIEVQSLLSKNVATAEPQDSADCKMEPRKETPKKERDKMDVLLSRQMLDKELPKFDGNPEEWPAFIAQFRQSTEDCQLSNAENMSRLRKSLRGVAKQTVQALMIMPQNVERVVTTLEQRFGRPDYVVRALITKAKRVPAPREEKWDSILDYANAVQNLVVTMESLKCQGHLMNPQLLEELVSKLPHHLKFEWGKKVDENMKESTTLTEFSEWLGTIATAASWIHVPKFASEEKHPKGCGKRIGREFRGDGTILTVTERSRDSNYNKYRYKGDTSPKCHFCERSNHLLKDCKEFTTASVEDRRKLAFDKGLCFSCLVPGHVIRSCRKKKCCNIGDCKSSHNSLLHDAYKESNVCDQSVNKTFPTRFERVTHTSGPRDTMKVILRVIPVILKGPAGEITSYALFDEAATVTLLDADVAEQLGICGPKEALCLQWTNDMTRREQDSQRVTVGISGVGKNDKPFKMHNVRTVKELSLPVQSIDVDELSTRWPYLQGLDVHSLNSVRPTILIGQDNVLLTTARKIVHGPFGAPVATKTWLGWTIHGPEGRPGRVDENIALHMCCVNENDPLHELVKESFSTEGFGVKITDNTYRTKEDQRAEFISDKTTRRLAERFETGLLWKNENVTLPDSKTNAIKRLNCLEQKMDRNPELSELYEQKVQEYVEKGYARKLTNEEAETKGPRTWYLPHFAIQNPNKPGKLRIVFDAAAKTQGASLNDYLMKGPDLNSSLYGVLLRFRQKKIGFAGDIREMFHQVRIIDSDLSSQRFLWRGGDRQRPPDTYEMQVMIFGAACSPYLAQYIKNRNAKEFQDEFPEGCKAIVERHYVDDYLDSADSEEEAEQLIKDVSEIHMRGGFEIRSWVSSSKEVLKTVSKQDQSSDVKQFDLKTNLNQGRVLGLWWDAERDSFAFRLNFPKINVELIEGTKQPTKREVLKTVMSIFDPIGFLAQLIVKAKILLQDIWRCGVGWDDEITDDLYQRWIKWTRELKGIVQVNVPRCYSTNLTTATSVQLHMFCDASEKAFSAVAYLRISKEEIIHTAFITARTRVAPLRPMTIPRLELQGAVMASRLAKTIQEELEVDLSDVYFWTDSKTVLSWIRADAKQFKPFVAHRIGEIQEITEVYQWHWISTKVNVADDATRDTKQCDFTPESRWFCGPPFLKLPTSQWPTETFVSTGTDEALEDDSEIKCRFIAVTMEVTEVLPKVERFSKFLKLLRTTAWMLRYRDNLKSRIYSNEGKKGELLPSEIDAAEVLWWKHAQRQSFPDEVRLLAANKELPKSSTIAKLTPEMDSQGVIRLRGRNALAPQISDATKNPVILERKHPYTCLMVQHFHEKFGHHGLETILNELRQKFWVPSVRSALKHASTICQLCKVKKAHPREPEMGQLPLARVTGYVPPFTFTGMDYFGPIDVTIGRRHEKRYGVLFTCLTIRAVHLEIANSLTTDSAIMAIRRMMARRGVPKEIFSDNGTNLKGADTELKAALQEFDQEKLTMEMSTKAITWHFIPPSAPHMGGSWERLVRSVKIALQAALKERAPKEEVLHTLLLEAENIVNSRPLTHVSVDPRDPESLTPNHFLLGSSNGAKSPVVTSDHDLCLRSQWRQAQRLSDMFWNRWVREYLPTLSRRTKFFQPSEPVKIGDVVVIADNVGPRNTWPLGRVTATFPGRDGVIRVVNVKTKSGTYRRPVVKLCILDVHQKTVSDEMMDAEKSRIIGREDVVDAVKTITF